MKHAWRNGTAPKCTAEVPQFVERHVHDNYVLTAGVKRLPIHRHLLHVERPTILRKPPHTVHKTLRVGGADRKAADRISGHPYKHAAATIASSRRHRTDDTAGDSDEDDMSKRQAAAPPSLFGVAGVIGGPEFDPYQQYRHNIYPFKEQLAHEVNILVLEKERLDKMRKQAAAVASAASRHHHHHHDADDDNDDDTDSCTYDDDDDDDGSDTDATLMSSSTLIDDDEEEDKLLD